MRGGARVVGVTHIATGAEGRDPWIIFFYIFLMQIFYSGGAFWLRKLATPVLHHHHHHVACPELDVAVRTSLLHACRFCARW